MRGTIQQRSSSSLFCRREQFWHGQGCPLFDVVYPAFPLPTMVSPPLHGALKGGFGEAVEACDMPDPCKFQSVDGCQTRFLRTHKEIDLALHPVVGHNVMCRLKWLLLAVYFHKIVSWLKWCLLALYSHNMVSWSELCLLAVYSHNMVSYLRRCPLAIYAHDMVSCWLHTVTTW